MSKDYKTTLMAICLAVLTTTAAGQGPRQPLSEEQKQLNTMHQVITSDKLFHYVEQLSDPALEGRLAGSPGGRDRRGLLQELGTESGRR
jgi:hypothetical protein